MGSEIEVRHSLYDSSGDHWKGEELEINDVLSHADYALGKEEGYFFDIKGEKLMFGFRTIATNAHKDDTYFFNVFRVDIDDAKEVGLQNLHTALEDVVVNSSSKFKGDNRSLYVKSGKRDVENRDVVDTLYNLSMDGETFATLPEITATILHTELSLEDVCFISDKNYPSEKFNACGDVTRRRSTPEDLVSELGEDFSYSEIKEYCEKAVDFSEDITAEIDNIDRIVKEKEREINSIITPDKDNDKVSQKIRELEDQVGESLEEIVHVIDSIDEYVEKVDDSVELREHVGNMNGFYEVVDEGARSRKDDPRNRTLLDLSLPTLTFPDYAWRLSKLNVGDVALSYPSPRFNRETLHVFISFTTLILVVLLLLSETGIDPVRVQIVYEVLRAVEVPI